jgi:hypothetical protein
VAVSAVLHQRVHGELAPISFYCRLLSPAEKKYITYEKECLAVIFGCDKCRVYLEHKEFELHCENLALCWLLKSTKDVGRIGGWILRLAPFTFRVRHTRVVENVVADTLSRMFEGDYRENPEGQCASLIQSLPLVYSSLEEHQKEDQWCNQILDEIQANRSQGGNFSICRNLLCYYPKCAKRRRWVVPASLRPTLLYYFHDTDLSGHRGARKTLSKITAKFWWPRMTAEVFKYVRRCDLCQRAKLAHNTCVGLHSRTPSSQPMECLLIDFVGHLTSTKRGNIAILVVLDVFSKFAFFCSS